MKGQAFNSSGVIFFFFNTKGGNGGGRARAEVEEGTANKKRTHRKKGSQKLYSGNEIRNCSHCLNHT